MSQASLFPSESGESASSPAASRARTSARREGAWDSSEGERAPYGWKWRGSSESVDRIGFSLRTFLLSTLAGLTSYSLAWKKRVTPRGRWWWVLGRSGRRTNGTGSGSLGGDWPTPQAADSERASEVMVRGNPTLLGAAKEWATPRASENENRSTKATPSQLAGKHGSYLAVQALADWPTPTAEPYGTNQGGAAGRVGQVRPSLEGCARQDWPTPKEVDGRPKGNAGGNRKSPGLDALARSGLLAGDSHSTNGSRRGSLNPDWVEALMGAPPGWTDLDDETVSGLWGMRTRRTSRSSSGGG